MCRKSFLSKLYFLCSVICFHRIYCNFLNTALRIGIFLYQFMKNPYDFLITVKHILGRKSVSNIKMVQDAFKRQTESLEKTDGMVGQANRLIHDVAEKVKEIETNSRELEKEKNFIIANMGSLENLSESNYSATENIVHRFKGIVRNALGVREKSLAVSDIYDEMKIPYPLSTQVGNRPYLMFAVADNRLCIR